MHPAYFFFELGAVHNVRGPCSKKLHLVAPFVYAYSIITILYYTGMGVMALIYVGVELYPLLIWELHWAH